MKLSRLARRAAIFTFLVTVILLFISLTRKDSKTRDAVKGILDTLGQTWWGGLVLAGLITAAQIFLVPGTPLNLAAGFIFGTAKGAPDFIVGFAVALGGFVCAAALSYYAGQWWLRECMVLLTPGMDKMMAKRPVLKAIDIAVQRKVRSILSFFF